MSIMAEIWAFAGVIVTQIAAVGMLLIKMREDRRAVDRVSAQVAPISNGFAHDVHIQLGQISTHVLNNRAAIERLAARLEEHERHHVRY